MAHQNTPYDEMHFDVKFAKTHKANVIVSKMTQNLVVGVQRDHSRQKLTMSTAINKLSTEQQLHVSCCTVTHAYLGTRNGKLQTMTFTSR